MLLSVNRILAPITVLGAGRRVGVWVQGCALACPGCASIDTWDSAQGVRYESAALAEKLADLVNRENLDGLTVTGGEPLDQAAQLAELISELKTRLSSSPQADRFDVLLFSGYARSAAQRRAGALWDMLDAAVCGPYRQQLPSDVALIASSNQEMVVLTDLADSKYSSSHGGHRMQVVSDGESLMMVGLPRPGELDHFASRLAERGIELAGVSWRS